MARPRSDDKRDAILEAAIRLIADRGLSASTAEIGKRANVAHGTVFNYFATKADLINAAYLYLKAELNETVLEDLPDSQDVRAQLHHLWTRWLHWGASNPERRRALAQLSVTDQITKESRAVSFENAAVGIDIVRRSYAKGALKDQSFDFVGSLVEALAGATMDAMIRNPESASSYREAAFEALWKALR